MNSQQSLDHFYEHTLRHRITCVGVGLHTGKRVSAVIKPAAAYSGINFYRKDCRPESGFIAGRWYNVIDTKLGTKIGNQKGAVLHTVEHLVAALTGSGVDNALIEVDGPEVPIMDGSAMPFVQMIKNVGLTKQNAERKVLCIQRPVEYQNGDKSAILLPERGTKYTVEIDFDNPLIGKQFMSFDFGQDRFASDLAPARTFAFVDQLEKYKSLGLIKGGSLNNAVVVNGKEILNAGGLRFHNEFVRHKLLDCVGDLGLIGFQLFGHFYARKPGHDLNNKFLRHLFSQRDAWTLVSRRDTERCPRLVADEPETDLCPNRKKINKECQIPQIRSRGSRRTEVSPK